MIGDAASRARRCAPSARWLPLLALASAIAAWSAGPGAARAQLVIEPGREEEVLALFRPHVLGGEVVPGWTLHGVAIGGDHVRVTVRGADGAERSLRLDQLGAVAPDRTSTSFAITLEDGDPRAGPALDALARAVEANDRRPFFRVRPTERIVAATRRSLDGIAVAIAGLLLLLALVGSQLREAPRRIAWGLLAVIAAGAVLRIALSPVTALGVWPYTRQLQLAVMAFDGPILAWATEAFSLRVHYTELLFTLNLVLAILTPLAIYAHAHYVLRDPRAALACAGLIAFFPNHIRFSHSEVEFVLSLALSSTTLAVLHAALVDTSRVRRWVCTLALPIVLYASVATRELNILLVPLGIAAALMLRGGSARARLAIVIAGIGLGAALGALHLAASYAPQVRDGLDVRTLLNGVEALFSVRYNTLINPRVTPPGVTALAVLGGWAMWRGGDRRHMLFVAGWLLAYFVAHSYVLPSQVEMQARYHLHLAPPLLLLAAPGLVHLWERHRRLAWAALAYVAISPLLHAGFVQEVGFNDMREYSFVRSARELLPDGCTVIEFQGRHDHDVRFVRMGAVVDEGTRRQLFTVVPAAALEPGSTDVLRERVRELARRPPECLAYYESLQCWGIKERDEPIAPACAALRALAPLEPIAQTRFEPRTYDENVSRGIDPAAGPITLTLYRVLPHGSRLREPEPEAR